MEMPPQFMVPNGEGCGMYQFVDGGVKSPWYSSCLKAMRQAS